MKLTITKESLLNGLHRVTGVVERRQNMPILANVLLRLEKNYLLLTGTDFDIELSSRVEVLESFEEGEITVPGRKLMDICRSFAPETVIALETASEKVLLTADKSRFTLQTRPAEDFPLMTVFEEKLSFTLKTAELHALLSNTHFAMAQQDVRYYLNGLFMELDRGHLTAVATDGHRLAMSRLPFQTDVSLSFIVPRKGAVELLRVLPCENPESLWQMRCAENMLKIEGEKFSFVSRLIDARFPSYERVIPKETDKKARIDKDSLRQVLQRVAILTHEKYRVAKLRFSERLLSLAGTNNDNEEAYDELPQIYNGEEAELAFNIQYLLDVLNALPEGEINIHFSQPDSSVLINSENLPGACYVIMPMSL